MGVGRSNISASRLGVTGSEFIRTFVMARIAGRMSMIRSWRVVVFLDEAAKMVSTNQFFNLVLECFANVCGMAIVMVIVAVFGHVDVGRIGRRARW